MSQPVCAVLIAVSLFGSGCALHEVRQAPPTLPAVFAGSAGDGSWPSARWYEAFGSTELQTLIGLASSSNLDLAMARARVTQADARARRAGAAILPSVDAGGNANYLAGHSSAGSAHETDWAALLSASYEVDFWGENRATARAASRLADAARADRDTVALTTLAAVADGYFQVLSLRERLDIARLNLDAAQKLLDVVQARFNVGVSNPVELATQKAALAAAGLVLPELKRQEAEALAALALLLGRTPENFSVEGRKLDALREPKIGSGLPSELLTRRPDIFMAESNMLAADADWVAARAALFPSLSLTAAGGVQNPAVNAAVISLSGVGPSLSLGASITQTIFDHGRLKALRTEAQAKDEELIAAYRAAILSALVDVENAFSALSRLDDAKALQAENLAQSERAFEGASLRYKAGAGDFLTVLEAQRTLYTAREQFSQYELARFQSLVALCKALGGGWQVRAPANSIKEAR
ncbi:MAG TPA: efflux transporter outer membrane subunit [Steroidobacteraceae bacterium]|jgi:NodT family efflux transporter outer membrane factor (OMF) lipoprotein|nr:efflux transporter outer membrane subunit [Steroidobacteraceae bacterium]